MNRLKRFRIDSVTAPLALSLSLPLSLGLLLAITLAPAASAESRSAWQRAFECERSFESVGAWARSHETLDLYNGILYFGIGGGMALLGQPGRRWTSVNSLDDAVRDDLRFDSGGARKKAVLASDLLVGASALIPMVTIGAHQVRTRDCVESWDMMTDFIEAFGLTVAITQSMKLAVGRARPFALECDGSPPSDAKCNSQERFLSFFSGHASLAATGAGITCAFAYKRNAWGTSAMAKAVPCGLGIGTALAASTLRIASDRHWVTDVALGLLVGGAVGYFDTWGPFELLKFEKRDARGGPALRGLVMPAQIDGRPGARLVMSF